ncbi:MAG: lipocalin family protein [Gammaproteobacteria bacterium]
MKILLNIFLLALILLASLSCVKNEEVKDNDVKATAALVGVWRGSGSYEDEENVGWAESWKIERHADGRYSVDYLIVHDGEKLFERSSDSGTWSYQGGVYYEINSQGAKVTYDVYSLKDDWFEYNIAQRDEDSANIEESKTVGTFVLQDPPEGYSEVTYEQPTEENVVDNSAIESE